MNPLKIKPSAIADGFFIIITDPKSAYISIIKKLIF